MDPWANTREQYREFARQALDSPCFVDWARHLAEDDEVLAHLADLPPVKRQPNLVFAAARWHGVRAPGPYDALRRALLADDGTIRATVLRRSTQTNEAGRLATLVPAFAQLASRSDRPLSLLEVGASAGLVLYPDRWSYRWRTPDGDVTAGQGPELSCDVTGPAPLPDEVPTVAGRHGLDLAPVDVTDPDAAAWLENLVWPEQEDRRQRLRTAIEVAASDPPQVVAADLLEDLPGRIERAAEDGVVVVFHSAVIAYLSPEDRTRFDTLIRGLVADGSCHWVSNEHASVLPSVTSTGPVVPPDLETFVLGIDGRAVAWTHGHGRTLRWLS